MMRLRNYTDAADKRAFAQAFSRLPDQVRTGRYRRALLPAQMEEALLDLPLPTPRDFWLSEDRGRPIGRISANVSHGYPDTGYVGFFEIDTRHAGAHEAARRLIEAACAFLRGKVSRVYGPVNLNTWLPYRFRVSESDDRCFPWEPVNPPDYVDHFLAAGFESKTDYHSTAFGNLERFLERTEPDYEDALAKGFRFRQLDRSRLFDREGPMIYRITVEAYQDSFLFETIPRALFERLPGTLGKPEQDCSHVAVSPQGDDVGFFYAFTDQCPSPSGAGREIYAVLKTTAVIRPARGQGLSNALAHLAVRSAVAMGADYAIAALVRAGVQSESYARKCEPFWQHCYTLFEKRL